MSNKSILSFCIFNGLVHNDSNSNLRHHICCYITNLTYDKLIMKIMRSSFIHKFIHSLLHIVPFCEGPNEKPKRFAKQKQKT